MGVHDIAQSLRIMVKRPAFTFFLVLIMALGIGFVTAIFSLMNAIFLGQVPFDNPDEIVMLRRKGPGPDSLREPVAYRDIQDWKERTGDVFQGIGAYSSVRSFTVTTDEGVDRHTGIFADPYFFDGMSVKFALGRAFTEAENQPPQGDTVVVLSNRVWQSRFGGDPEILGKSLSINGEPYVVVGVMAQGTRWFFSEPADLTIPLRRVAAHLTPLLLENRLFYWMDSVARLKPGVTIRRAQERMASISKQLQEENPDTNVNVEGIAIPFKEIRSNFGALNNVVFVLGAGAVFVFLLSCINAVLLLLLRFIERYRDFAVRMALGASRKSLVLRSMMENLVLALLAGAAGLFLAYLAVKVIFASTPLELAYFIDVKVDAATFLVAILVALAAAALFGLVPAVASSRVSFQEVLRPGGSDAAAGSARSLSRRILIMVQVALSVVVLIDTGLIIRSFYVFNETDYGFNTKDLLYMNVSLDGPRYADAAARRTFYRSLEEKLAALPGVEGSGLWGPGVPGFNEVFRELIPEGGDPATDRFQVWGHVTTPEGIKNIGLRLVDGRLLESTDHGEAPGVLVVSESAARALWPNEDALGKRVSGAGLGPELFTVVGVVADARHRGRALDTYFPEDFYTSYYQVPLPQVSIYVRTDQDRAAMVSAIRKAVKDLDPGLPLYNVTTMAEMMGRETNTLLFYVRIMTLFALAALLLTTLGIYSIVAYNADRRSREIGIRVALGAEKRNVTTLMIRQTAIDMAIGLGSGILGALVLNRIVSSLLYGVQPTDLLSFLLPVPILILVALVATFLPTKRALAVDPAEVLRFE